MVSWANQGSVAKFVCILPFSLEHCVQYRFASSCIVQYDGNCTVTKDLEYYDNPTLQKMYPKQVSSNKRECAIVSFDCVLPFPLTTKRRYLTVSSAEYYPHENQYLMIHKPCKHNKYELPKGWYDLFDFQVILLRKLDSERTLMIEAHIFVSSLGLHTNNCTTELGWLGQFAAFESINNV